MRAGLCIISLLLAFVVFTVAIRPEIGNMGLTTSGSLDSGHVSSAGKHEKGPVGTGSTLRRPDPAATIEEREERRDKGEPRLGTMPSTMRRGSECIAKSSNSPTPTQRRNNHHLLRPGGGGGSHNSASRVADSIDERDCTSSISSSSSSSNSDIKSDGVQRSAARPLQHSSINSISGGHSTVAQSSSSASGAGMNIHGQGHNYNGSDGGDDDDSSDDDGDLDAVPSAEELARAMGGDLGGNGINNHPGEGMFNGENGGGGGSDLLSSPDRASSSHQQSQQKHPVGIGKGHHAGNAQQPQQQQQHQRQHLQQQQDMPSKQQLYGNNDLSQVDKDYIFEGLRKLYTTKVLPLEVASKYSHFASPPMSHSDFEAKPMVLIIGQYSVGKTSFIRSLVKQDFPGQRIGPEPTTDRFTAIMHSNSRSHLQQQGGKHQQQQQQQQGRVSPGRLIPGHALVMESDKPFSGLGSMGNNFLSKFEGAEIDASILRNITIVDTPGVLAGEKQRIGRDYDFSEVIKWFAERADMIIVMFDGHKLDISDELKTVLDALKPHQDKLRVLLNKADSIDTQSLLRVYGALMWSLGKVVGTPEACRIYLGSFWDGPLKLQDNAALLHREKADLLNEMSCLPANAVIRRINELVKRARSVKVHAYIIHYLKKQMPYLVGKSEKQARLLERLDKEFLACARRYNLPLGDFPPVDQYRKMLAEVKDISDFKKLDKRLVVEMDRVLTHDIPLLLQKAQRRKPAFNNLHQQQRMQQQQHHHQPHRGNPHHPNSQQFFGGRGQ